MIIVCAALLAGTAGTASAAGVNFAWTRCYGECAGTQNMTFACNTNTGNNVAVGSFVAPPGVTALSGNEIVIDLQSSSATLPAWWQFKSSGTCRQTSLSVNFNANPADVVCIDEFGGGAAGGIGAYTIGYGASPSRARLVMAIATASPGPVEAEAEYFAFNLVINHAKSVGTGACAGCLTPVVLVLNSIKLTQPVGVGDFVLGQPATSGSNWLNWQNGSIGDTVCPADTPTRNSTWGQVKSLYR